MLKDLLTFAVIQIVAILHLYLYTVKIVSSEDYILSLEKGTPTSNRQRLILFYIFIINNITNV